jgi:hypothetical protein
MRMDTCLAVLHLEGVTLVSLHVRLQIGILVFLFDETTSFDKARLSVRLDFCCISIRQRCLNIFVSIDIHDELVCVYRYAYTLYI